MMQNAPGIYDIECAERFEKSWVKDRALRHTPIYIVVEIAPPNLSCARHRLGVIVKGNDARAEAPRCQTEQAAAAANIEKCSPLQAVSLQEILERLLSFKDSFVAEHTKEAAPIAAKLESISGLNF